MTAQILYLPKALDHGCRGPGRCALCNPRRTVKDVIDLRAKRMQRVPVELPSDCEPKGAA